MHLSMLVTRAGGGEDTDWGGDTGWGGDFDPKGKFCVKPPDPWAKFQVQSSPR